MARPGESQDEFEEDPDEDEQNPLENEFQKKLRKKRYAKYLAEKERKKSEKTKAQNDEKARIKDTSKPKPPNLDSALTMFMNLIQLNVSRIHIRFEDDYFASDSPYSMGILVDSLNVNTANKDIRFSDPMDLEYQEFDPPNPNDIFLKHILVGGVSVYWNSKSENLIPSS